MIRVGDEFLNTQFGNNNPYNQDNETGWLDWSQVQANQDIFRFFNSMIAFPAGALVRISIRQDCNHFPAALRTTASQGRSFSAS